MSGIMTFLDVCDEIEKAMNALSEETASENWAICHTAELTDESHASLLAETLAKTRAHLELPEKTSMWFLSIAGSGGATLALCGNTTQAKARAEYLAWFRPHIVRALIAHIRELEAAK